MKVGIPMFNFYHSNAKLLKAIALTGLLEVLFFFFHIIIERHWFTYPVLSPLGFQLTATYQTLTLTNGDDLFYILSGISSIIFSGLFLRYAFNKNFLAEGALLFFTMNVIGFLGLGLGLISTTSVSYLIIAGINILCSICAFFFFSVSFYHCPKNRKASYVSFICLLVIILNTLMSLIEPETFFVYSEIINTITLVAYTGFLSYLGFKQANVEARLDSETFH